MPAENRTGNPFVVHTVYAVTPTVTVEEVVAVPPTLMSRLDADRSAEVNWPLPAQPK